jgi:hypothetical protein
MGAILSRLIDVRKLGKADYFRTTMVSGLVTGVAAGTSSAGHLAFFRNPHATIFSYVTRIRMFWQTATGFTAQQEVALELFKASTFSAAHTGGTAVTPQKRRTQGASPKTPAASVCTAMVATTGALTAGTHTLAAQPIVRRSVLELADGAAVAKRDFEMVWQPRDDSGEVLGTNEGLILRNAIAMGAAGVGRFMLEIDHYER